MLRYTGLLLKLRFRLTWNSWRRWSWGRKLLMIAIFLILAATTVGIYGMSWGVGLGLRAFLGPVFIGRLLPLFFLAAYFFLFTGTFATALAELYLANDLELLLAAPIPMRAVFTAKFLRGLLSNYGLWFFFGLPAALGLGAGAGYHWLYFPFLVLVFLAVPLIPNGLGALTVIVLARYIPARRLREIIAVLGGLAGVACYLVSQLAGPALEQNSIWTSPAQAQALAQQALSIDLFFLPSSWAGNGLAAAGAGQWDWATLYLGLFALVSAAVYGVCLLAAERLYYIGWAGLGTVVARRARPAPAQERSHPTTRRRPLLPPDIWAVAWKDFKYLRRDMRVLIQTAIWPVVVIIVLMSRMFIAGQGGEELPPAVASLASIGSGGMILFLIATMFSRLSLVAVSQEGRNYWILRAAPLSASRLLAGKLVVAYIPLVVLGAVLMLIFSLLMGEGLVEIAWNLLMIALAGLGISAIALGMGAAFPRFTWDNPQRVVSPAAFFLAMLLYGLYVLLIFLVFSLPRLIELLATGVPSGTGETFALPALAGWTWAGYAIALPVALILTVISVVAPLYVAARRLDQVEV